jgi:hypothetical protein
MRGVLFFLRAMRVDFGRGDADREDEDEADDDADALHEPLAHAKLRDVDDNVPSPPRHKVRAARRQAPAPPERRV